ncbi:hypothetical protein, partial [Burkholderia glumae]
PTFTKHSSNLAARSSVGTSSDELSRVFELASKKRFHKDGCARRRVFQQIKQQPSLRNAS